MVTITLNGIEASPVLEEFVDKYNLQQAKDSKGNLKFNNVFVDGERKDVPVYVLPPIECKVVLGDLQAIKKAKEDRLKKAFDEIVKIASKNVEAMREVVKSYDHALMTAAMNAQRARFTKGETKTSVLKKKSTERDRLVDLMNQVEKGEITYDQMREIAKKEGLI